jgi:hypothetical protein
MATRHLRPDCHPRGNEMTEPTPGKAEAISPQPHTASALLRLLGVPNASALRQRAVLAAWLEHNTATPELQLSMRANGYGILLPPLRHRLPLSPVAGPSTPVSKAS